MERFIKLICRKSWKPIYSLHTTHLKISYYHSLSKKIKGIVYMFPNIIHLDFKKVEHFTSKALKLIMKSYPTLKYLNISILYGKKLADYISIVWEYSDKNLCIIANLCHKLEYLNSSNYTEFSEISIYNVIHSCPKLQQLDLNFCGISNITIEEIVRLYPNLNILIWEGIIKLVKKL